MRFRYCRKVYFKRSVIQILVFELTMLDRLEFIVAEERDKYSEFLYELSFKSILPISEEKFWNLVLGTR